MKPVAGFSLVELLVATAVIGVLAVMLTAAVGAVRDRAKTTACAANLRQWGTALQLDLADHDGRLPRRGQGVQPVRVIDRPEDWFNALPPYLGMDTYAERVERGDPVRPGENSVFVCPAATVTNSFEHFICYGMNMYLSRWDQPEPTAAAALPDPAHLAFMADSPGGYASTVPSAAQYSVMPRHGGAANVLFVDGHVELFDGDYLGCGTGDRTQSDVRWQTLVEGDRWRPR